MTIKEIIAKYKGKIDQLDLEILIAHSLGKTREFVLIHDENSATNNQSIAINELIKKRIKGEPVAYLVGHKEFFGLDFIVDSHTLVPRPETEMLVESVISEQQTADDVHDHCTVIDIGTGSGNIIVSIAKVLERGAWSVERTNEIKYYATDISKEALKIARKNARLHGVAKKINFLQGNLLSPFFPELKKLQANKLTPKKLIFVANLPYLSKEIYQRAPRDVKKYEPKTALFSNENGLAHYRELLEQIEKMMFTVHCSLFTVFLEISPEQKLPLTKLVKTIFPTAKIEFKKDLAGKWRMCKIFFSPN